MTNGQKFPTTRERTDAFDIFCRAQGKCDECPLRFHVGRTMSHLPACAFAWQELEYEPRIDPCPFCGGECGLRTLGPLDVGTVRQVHCHQCRYASREWFTEVEAIEAHNRVARAAKKGEAK